MRIKPDDVALNKAAIIERCIRRIREEYAAAPDLQNYTHIDAMTLNIERACQACIDLAMHIVAGQHLGMPQSSSDAFRLLTESGLISPETKKAMRTMTGFRNIAIHQYEELDLGVLRFIAEEAWNDLVTFCRELGLKINPRGRCRTDSR